MATASVETLCNGSSKMPVHQIEIASPHIIHMLSLIISREQLYAIFSPSLYRSQVSEPYGWYPLGNYDLLCSQRTAYSHTLSYFL
jgi:hypothetical protein